MSKYDKLWQYVKETGKKTLKISFTEIQNVIGFSVDHSFLKYKKESEKYGYTVGKISMKEQTVTFKKLPKNETLVIYIHGKGGNADESENYRRILPYYDVIGFDYKSDTPQQAEKEFPEAFDNLTKEYETVFLIANSIGAYFAMCTLADKNVVRAFFISPVVDMEKLIFGMMKRANVSESQLKKALTVKTDFGETLSWEYLQYVRAHPINWKTPACVLYGEKDVLTDTATITAFTKKIRASLTIMQNGEHWFHTSEQMNFLNDWLIKNIKEI